MIESLKNITIGEIVKNGIPYESQNIPQSLKQNMRDKEILVVFFKENYPKTYQKFLGTLNKPDDQTKSDDQQSQHNDKNTSFLSQLIAFFLEIFNNESRHLIDNTEDEEKLHPLSIAFAKIHHGEEVEKHTEIMRILLKNGANREEFFKEIDTYLLVEKPRILDLLVDQENINRSYGLSCRSYFIGLAIANGHPESVKLLLEKGCDITNIHKKVDMFREESPIEFINNAIEKFDNETDRETFTQDKINRFKEIKEILNLHFSKKQQGSTSIIINGDVEPIQNRAHSPVN